jgi:hypothetical protein
VTKPENPPAPRDEREEARRLERDITEAVHRGHFEKAWGYLASLTASVVAVCEQRDALLKPHSPDGTITCGSCGKTLGSDGLVEALQEALRERDSLKEQLVNAEKARAHRGCNNAHGHCDSCHDDVYAGWDSETACCSMLDDLERQADSLKGQLAGAHVRRCLCCDDVIPDDIDPRCAELRRG